MSDFQNDPGLFLFATESVAAWPQPENLEDVLSALTLHLLYESNFRELFVT